MARHRSSTKKAPPEIGLHMECVEEDLQPSQIAYYAKAEKEYTEVQNKLDAYIKNLKAEVVEKGENCLVLQVNAMPSVGASGSLSTTSTSGKVTRQSVQTNQNYQSVVGQGILTRSAANSHGNTYFVMDPCLRLMVGQLPSENVSTDQAAISIASKSATGRNRQSVTSSPVIAKTRTKNSNKKQNVPQTEQEILSSPATRTKTKSITQIPQTLPQIVPHIVQEQQISGNILGTNGNFRIKMNAKQIPPPLKPEENNSIGGLLAGSKTPWKPNIDEGTNSKSTADCKEVTFNKVTGKTFPSLVVTARPHLQSKFLSQAKITQERAGLDSKVKGVLMYTTAKFTEWLIQKGLIRSEQTCPVHLNNDFSPVKLKLGMFSDVSKFPYSGGYVWISDCCPSQFVSVFSGSLFEGAPHPPTTLLKLIYHWACQTNIQNIVQWVKVDNLYVKNFFTNMRAVCTQAVQEKFKKMGGPRKKIEVGVISLGTTSQDGNKRQVKVEVLGVMDFENKLIRLRALEPRLDERNFKRRFIKILQPLEEWVYKDSIILTDFTVNKAALNYMGFHSIFQGATDIKYSNQNVMEYLRRIVPRMFQNTLSLLSRQIIQQFLDELMWRECWGSFASQAFNNIITHIAEQTKLDVPENFLSRLAKVSANPFKEWNYSVWNFSGGSMKVSMKPNQQSPVSQEPISPSLDVNSSQQWTTGDSSGKGTRTRKRGTEQLTEITPSSILAKRVAKGPAKEKVKKDEKSKPFDKIIQKETGEKLSEEIIKFIDEGNQIPLESFYYGNKKGEEWSVEKKTVEFSVKCCLCNKTFFENILLMKHMILHCQVEPPLKVDLKKVYQCDNCFLGFNTSGDLEKHLEEVHFLVDGKFTWKFICHICELKFPARKELVYHMQRAHIELEMPYECGVCRFRTSIYRYFVEHFRQVHRGEDWVFCPYCLKVVTLSHKGKSIPLNVMFLMSHIEKHQRLTLVKDCDHCQLSFIHFGIWEQHLEADHKSFKGDNGIEFLSDLSTGLLMPEPGELIKLTDSRAFSSFRLHKMSKTKHLFTFNKFKLLEFENLDENSTCIECEEFFDKSEHFVGTFNCLKCQYATCCERAMTEHLAVFHETGTLQYTIGAPTVLSAETFCICGYSTYSGNRMAKHLALCNKKTAYASLEFIQDNYWNADDGVEEKGERQNVLNMLGLIRKSPEDCVSGSETTREDLEKSTESLSENTEILEPVKDSLEIIEPVREIVRVEGPEKTYFHEGEEAMEVDLEENIKMDMDEDELIKDNNGECKIMDENLKDEKEVINKEDSQIVLGEEPLAMNTKGNEEVSKDEVKSVEESEKDLVEKMKESPYSDSKLKSDGEDNEAEVGNLPKEDNNVADIKIDKDEVISETEQATAIEIVRGSSVSTTPLETDSTSATENLTNLSPSLLEGTMEPEINGKSSVSDLETKKEILDSSKDEVESLETENKELLFSQEKYNIESEGSRDENAEKNEAVFSEEKYSSCIKASSPTNVENNETIFHEEKNSLEVQSPCSENIENSEIIVSEEKETSEASRILNAKISDSLSSVQNHSASENEKLVEESTGDESKQIEELDKECSFMPTNDVLKVREQEVDVRCKEEGTLEMDKNSEKDFECVGQPEKMEIEDSDVKPNESTNNDLPEGKDADPTLSVPVEKTQSETEIGESRSE